MLKSLSIINIKHACLWIVNSSLFSIHFLERQTKCVGSLLSPVQPQQPLPWRWQGWSCQRCVWSWVCRPARWSTSSLGEQMLTWHSPSGRCCRRPSQTAAAASVISLQRDQHIGVTTRYNNNSNTTIFSVYLCIIHVPGVTRSPAMACSSCVMASLSSWLLWGILVWSGFLTVSSVSIHWEGQIHNKQHVQDSLFYIQKSRSRWVAGAYFLWRPVLRNLDIWENPGHCLSGEVLIDLKV